MIVLYSLKNYMPGVCLEIKMEIYNLLIFTEILSKFIII